MTDWNSFSAEFQTAAAYYREQNRPGDQELLIEFLRETQEICGCIPDSTKDCIADIMQVAPAVIDTYIRLYPSLCSQKYETKIIVCTGSTCSQKGSAAVLKKLEQKLGIRQGEVTSDGKYLLCTQKCFKQCGQGVNVKIGEQMYHRVTESRIDELFPQRNHDAV